MLCIFFSLNCISLQNRSKSERQTWFCLPQMVESCSLWSKASHHSCNVLWFSYSSCHTLSVTSSPEDKIEKAAFENSMNHFKTIEDLSATPHGFTITGSSHEKLCRQNDCLTAAKYLHCGTEFQVYSLNIRITSNKWFCVCETRTLLIKLTDMGH